MRRRTATDRTPISEDIFGELFHHVNGSSEPLSSDAQKLLDSGDMTIKDVSHEITKDARFTEDKFLFHVPIAINFKSPDKPLKFNDKVQECLRENSNVKVVGIDRGERNLLYLTLVDSDGNILEQRSLNSVVRTREDGVSESTEYQKKLVQMERARDNARKNWDEIGVIKDLKEGYLSVVVHEIARMMVENNAIVVLEDLNVGFKQGRFAIERQVYQKFEKALIDKLNYLVFKDRGMDCAGGLLHGYQLTDAFESFDKIGKQTGFIFYVPAGYTSKIDPTTGFTNLFNTKKCTNAQGIRDFFLAFDSILWDTSRKAFAFSFDYDNFKTSNQSHITKWTVYSAKRRLVFDKDIKGPKGINPTEEILKALEKRGIAVSDGVDLKSIIEETEPSKENAWFFHKVFYAFDKTLQMRNSDSKTGEDYIESPVLNGNGEFFDSRKASKELPIDADANGAYHIAMKGVQLLEEIIAQGKTDLRIENKDWFRFIQERANRRFKNN